MCWNKSADTESPTITYPICRGANNVRIHGRGRRELMLQRDNNFLCAGETKYLRATVIITSLPLSVGSTTSVYSAPLTRSKPLHLSRLLVSLFLSLTRVFIVR